LTARDDLSRILLVKFHRRAILIDAQSVQDKEGISFHNRLVFFRRLHLELELEILIC
jgi:hypothetical protein